MKSHRPRLAVAVVAAALLSAACGGPASVTSVQAAPGTASVTVQPSLAQTAPGASVAFSAVVSGIADETVSWSIEEGASGGSIDGAGVYTAPATPGDYHVVATSVAQPQARSVAAVKIARQAGAITRVSVQDATVAASGSVTLVASVTATGTIDTSVTWTVASGSLGSIDPSTGVYTAPATAGAYTVWATSNADSSMRDFGNVTVVAAAQTAAISVSPSTSAASPGQAVQFTASVTGVSDTVALWTVQEGAAGGTVTSSGLYTAPSTPGSYHVIATSRASASTVAVATVAVAAVTPPPPPSSGPAYYVAHGGSDSAAGTLAAPWRTLRYAMRQLRAGDTLFIRGAPAGASTTAACDGSDSGACWTETDGCGFGTCSPLHWDGAGVSAGTGDASRVTVKAYQDEVVIIEPASGDKVVAFNPSQGPASCSYVTLENLILDGRHVGGETVRVDPETIYSNPDTGHCKYVNVNGGIIRHGKFTAGVALVGSYWTFTNVEFTENGTQTTSGDHDHAIYLQGTHNRFIGGRIHHNMQGVQCWNEFLNGNGYQGHNEFRGVEIDHNGVNPWGGYVRNGTGPELGLYHDVCTYSVVDSCNVHDNTSGSIGVSGDWGPIPASYSTISNNHVWGNGSDPIYIGNAVGTVLSGNVYSAP